MKRKILVLILESLGVIPVKVMVGLKFLLQKILTQFAHFVTESDTQKGQMRLYGTGRQ